MSQGWRKATTSVISATDLARAGRAKGHAKTRCIVAAKRVGAHIGLKAADMLLLDTLAAFAQPQDWEEGRQPIVWASNAYLMEQTGFSLSTLKRHARKLAEAGLIAFQDSPNGKRWGRRNAEGFIVEAYGFDLSPLSARAEEFEALAQDLATERALCQRLRRQITIARRSIRALLDTATGQERDRLQSAFVTLLGQLPSARTPSDALRRVLDVFNGLLHEVERHVLRTSRTSTVENINDNSAKVTPKGAISDPHILTTKQPYSVTCSSSDKDINNNHTPVQHVQTHMKEPTSDDTKEAKARRNIRVDVAVIMQACPEFASWARNLGTYVRDWSDFVRIAGRLRTMIGVSEHAWMQAQERMGRPIAAAALALVFEKVHSGEVASPSGYLSGMARKADAGNLHLERSFFGRLSAAAA